MIRRVSARLALLVAIVLTIGCDRVTKHVATTALAGAPGRLYLADTIRLEYVENTGGFLSLGANLPRTARTALFTIGTGLMLLVLVGAAVRLHWRGSLLIGAGRSWPLTDGDLQPAQFDAPPARLRRWDAGKGTIPITLFKP